ncbi:ubiquitin carboxyl-terminal hydrolase 10-like isoform X2 [Ruditapes philippinarum]|uniref:ubiquitin carboxyl-terminal hydrolase 10-like isoform X2 n=1 Tax=Ruditapes philippinarum TaxID=129788 RepID=UPI00295B894E|nr:ubiquitin carboxyl-terminal hydrolase 10-like isoform X2 [Ruditapes philippinarum]
MALSNEGFMFGRFDDLSPDEQYRIYKILHRQKGEPGSRVEFPWDKEEDEVSGAVGGTTLQEKNLAVTGLEFGFQGDTNEGVQFSFMSGDSLMIQSGNFEGGMYNPVNVDQPVPTNADQFQGQFMVPGSGAYPEPGSNQFMSENMKPAMERIQYNEFSQFNNQMESADERSGLNSKLQASMKPYERRNKKKRPPGYYKQSDSSVPQQNSNDFAPMQPDLTQPPPNFHPDMHYNMPPPGLVPNQYTVNNQYSEVNRENVANFPAGIPVAYQGAPTPTGAGNMVVDNDNVKNNQRQEMGDLYEVVIDSGAPQNSANIPARPETYQIQDHERTNSQSSVDNVNQSSSNVCEFIPNTNVAIENRMSQLNVQSSGVAKPTRVDVSIKDAQVIDEPSHMPLNTVQISQEKQVIDINTKEANDANDSKYSDNAAEFMDDSKMKSDSEIKDEPVVSTEPSVEPETSAVKNPEPVIQEPVKTAKPVSWAGLFKSNNSNVTTPEAPMSYRSSGGDNSSVGADSEQRSEKELSPMPVPASEDSAAKELGEHLSKMVISHASVSLQPRGLVNRANWCYINGTLQALVACPPFYNLLKKLPRYPALSRGPSSTPILDALVEFVHEFMPMSRNFEKGHKGVRDITPGQPFEPAYVYKMLQAIAVNPHFKLGKQEDAEEFLSCILDGMHEEMSAAVNLNSNNIDGNGNETVESEDGYVNGYIHAEGEELEGEPEDSWEQVGPKKKSVLTRRANFAKTPIADIFAGLVRSAVYKSSSKETATLEPFFTLQLDIQSEKVWTVKDALEGLVSKEQISGYTCSKTNSEVEVMKKLSLEELPPVLILHLKCFVYNKDGGSQKLMKKVDYGIELEITKDLLSPSARSKLTVNQRSYKLFAVVYHHGKKATGGHYTTNVFHPGINGWVNSDDSQVKTVTALSVLKYSPPRVPYLLYYRRLDSH